MGDDNCRLPNCERDRRKSGGYSGRFCSDEHEVKYDHLKDDARSARREEQSEPRVSKRDRPECDGPPF
jgi:hypothetical protein